MGDDRDKRDHHGPRAGDVKPFGAGVPADKGDSDRASKPADKPTPADNPAEADKPDDAIEGGAFIRGAGKDVVVIGSDGEVRDDLKVGKDKDGNPKIVKK